MNHSPGFLKIVEETRPRVAEITVAEARARIEANCGAILVDVREDSEWQQGHAIEAVHIGKGVLERDLEGKINEPNAEILMYCGGGYRSVLAADMAVKMGYSKVFSIAGGYKKMVDSGWKTTAG